jgi:hypothetical protein
MFPNEEEKDDESDLIDLDDKISDEELERKFVVRPN